VSRVVERSAASSFHPWSHEKVLIDYAASPPWVATHWDVVRAVEAAEEAGKMHAALLDRLPAEVAA